MEVSELRHYGIKGMKWGVRRYQNADGSLTSAGKARYGGSSEDSTSQSTSSGTSGKKTAAVAAGSVIAAATVAAAAVYVHQNPDAIGKVVSTIKNSKMSDLGDSAVSKGKQYVSDALKGAKEGAEEAVREAPKKATKAIVTGVIMNQAKKAVDAAVGKEESAKIFQANDNKKIGKFWKVTQEDKDDNDD